jgi:hypothetical protein
MNKKENHFKILRLFENIRSLLLDKGAGFEICKKIDMNEKLDFMDYEKKLLTYSINYRPSLFQGSTQNNEKVNVRGLLTFLKKEGLKFGRNPIPVYKQGAFKTKIDLNYLWVINNLDFLIDIFKIRIQRNEKEWENAENSLVDYQKYLSEEGIKIDSSKKSSMKICCPYCFKEIQNESVICSFCEIDLSDTKEKSSFS